MLAIAAIGGIAAGAGAATAQETTARVSVSSLGVEAELESGIRQSAPTGDSSRSSHRHDVFVHDRMTGATERVSVDDDEEEGDANSGFVFGPAGSQLAISDDGRFVAFESGATTWLPERSMANGVEDIFVRDRQTDTTERVSISDDEQEGNGASQSHRDQRRRPQRRLRFRRDRSRFGQHERRDRRLRARPCRGRHRYTIEVTNDGDLDAPNVVVTDHLESEMPTIGVNEGSFMSTHEGTWTLIDSTNTTDLRAEIPLMPASETATLSFSVATVFDAIGAVELTDTASVESDLADPDTTNDTVQLVTPIP